MEGFRDGIEADAGTGELILLERDGCLCGVLAFRGMDYVDTRWEDNMR